MDGEGSVRSALPDERWAPEPPEGLYVHVPFCVSVCPYCDFVVVGGAAARGPTALIDQLVDALHVELSLRADRQSGDGPLTSVYIGGARRPCCRQLRSRVCSTTSSAGSASRRARRSRSRPTRDPTTAATCPDSVPPA